MQVITKYKKRMSQNLIDPTESEEIINNNLGTMIQIIKLTIHMVYLIVKEIHTTIMAMDKFFGTKL